jgi:hypothetical protein
VPAFAALWSSEDELVGHHRRYRVRPLGDQLRAAGFSVDYATYVFSPLVLPLFLLRTVPSRLGRRQTLDAARTKAELEPASSVIVGAVTTMLDREVVLVRRGHRIPAGTSCLIAATARPPVRV